METKKKEEKRSSRGGSGGHWSSPSDRLSLSLRSSLSVSLTDMYGTQVVRRRRSDLEAAGSREYEEGSSSGAFFLDRDFLRTWRALVNPPLRFQDFLDLMKKAELDGKKAKEELDLKKKELNLKKEELNLKKEADQQKKKKKLEKEGRKKEEEKKKKKQNIRKIHENMAWTKKNFARCKQQ